MIFADIPAVEAEGAILAHSQQVGARTFKKGIKLTADHVRALRDAGVETVVAARLEPGDLDEDAGARRVAQACAGAGVSVSTAATGRVNLFAEADGVAVFDRDRLDAVNLVAEEITLAAVHAYDRVERGQLIATVKVIPLGLAEATAEAAAAAARAGGAPLIRVAAFTQRACGLAADHPARHPRQGARQDHRGRDRPGRGAARPPGRGDARAPRHGRRRPRAGASFAARAPS
ncbi:MAG: hypothetical protein U5L06_09035 [Rhodovibrio sp.]|nr:hypothetical protein [Rhodovibrio sp.]